MDITILIFYLLVLLFSVIMHELAHGYVAFSLGDHTAKYEGRLTLNPLKHLDPFGSVILPLLLFVSKAPILIGWAKPVPINPYNFKDQKWGGLKVAAAGPATNFAIAIIFGLLIRAFGSFQNPILDFFEIVVSLNLMLAVFNLVPIPPLDGSWILFHFLPDKFNYIKIFMQQYGMLILIFFLFFIGPRFLGAIINFLFFIITGNELLT